MHPHRLRECCLSGAYQKPPSVARHRRPRCTSRRTSKGTVEECIHRLDDGGPIGLFARQEQAAANETLDFSIIHGWSCLTGRTVGAVGRTDVTGAGDENRGGDRTGRGRYAGNRGIAWVSWHGTALAILYTRRMMLVQVHAPHFVAGLVRRASYGADVPRGADGPAGGANSPGAGSHHGGDHRTGRGHYRGAVTMRFALLSSVVKSGIETALRPSSATICRSCSRSPPSAWRDRHRTASP
jgi:hypothetical protein